METSPQNFPGNNGKILLIGCGILKKEIQFLIAKNDWPVEVFFLESSLHSNFNVLCKELKTTLVQHRKQHTAVFYGCCHPHIDKIVEKANTVRTAGQNCVEMLLGAPLFTRELEQGAYFLFEGWMKYWDNIIMGTLGTSNIEVVKEIFRVDRKYLLGLRTPCSGDFAVEAEAAGRMVGLPVRWMDVPLDHLEEVLHKVLLRKMRELKWEKN